MFPSRLITLSSVLLTKKNSVLAIPLDGVNLKLYLYESPTPKTIFSAGSEHEVASCLQENFALVYPEDNVSFMPIAYTLTVYVPVSKLNIFALVVLAFLAIVSLTLLFCSS